MSTVGIDPLNQIIVNKLDALKANFNSELFTANGTWTQPTGIDHVFVTMVGGGGGGFTGGANGSGGGGSGAAIIRAKIPAI
jgi:uncharacterized membrane protein